MPGLKGIQNGTEFFWLKWFQKIIGGSYIIAFHSEITAGSDKKQGCSYRTVFGSCAQLPYLSFRPYKYPGTGSEIFRADNLQKILLR